MNISQRAFAASFLFAGTFVAAFSSVEVRNLSTRGHVGTGDGTMIVGVVVEGNPDDYVPVRFRGIGPWLADFGVSDVVADPRITLYEGSTPIGSNDDWTLGGQFHAISATGYAPENESESALMVILPPAP